MLLLLLLLLIKNIFLILNIHKWYPGICFDGKYRTTIRAYSHNNPRLQFIYLIIKTGFLILGFTKLRLFPYSINTNEDIAMILSINLLQFMWNETRNLLYSHLHSNIVCAVSTFRNTRYGHRLWNSKGVNDDAACHQLLLTIFCL